MQLGNDLFQVLFEQSPDAIVVITPATGLPVCFNDRALELLGYERDQFAAMRLVDCKVAVAGPAAEACVAEALRSGAGDCETMFRRNDGAVINVRVTVRPVEVGGVHLLQAVIRDITEKKRVEEQLRLLNDSFLNFGPDITANINLITGAVGSIMGATCAMYNRLDGDLLCSVGQWQAPPDLPKLARPEGHVCYDVIRSGLRAPLFIADLGASPYAVCDPNVNRYGLKTYAGVPVYWGNTAVGSLCVVYDRTVVLAEAEMSFLAIAAGAIAVEEERWRAGDMLREQQRFTDSIINSLETGLVVIDADYRVIAANSAYAQYFGVPQSEIVGKKCYEVVYDSDTPCAGVGKVCPVQLTMDSGQPASLVRTDTEVVASGRIIEIKSFPLKDASGEITAVIELTNDITDKAKLEEQERTIEKLESLGILAGGIAHDFNNILTAILGNISLARFQAHEPAKVHQRLEEAESAAVRAKELTQQLLTFARGGEPVKKVIEVRGLLEEAAGFATHGSAVKCEFSLAEDLRPVQADEGQLSQVIHNLILNAVQAMPEGGTIHITASNGHSLQDGSDTVKISIADAGTGIPDHLLPRIFEPYFTTKQQGSGLGLATSYSIVTKHGGTIAVESTLGTGTTFFITLPAAARAAVPAPEPQTEPARGRGRILVMDDEEIVRTIAKVSLEELGYEVECVADGAAAVDLYRMRQEEGNPFAAVIMDLTIPGGVGGKEAISLLRQIDPDVRAIVSSGYASDPVMARFREYGFSAVLSKPYRLQEMSEVLSGLGALGH